MPSLAHPALGTSRTVSRIQRRRTPIKYYFSIVPSRDSDSLVQSLFFKKIAKNS